MDVLHFLSVIYKAYDGSLLSTLVYEGASSREKFNGILIESYCGIFCSKIITRFGIIRISYGCIDNFKTIDAYIQSRITYKKIIDEDSTTVRVGPFYLVTHIDEVPVSHDNVDGITYETYYKYVRRLSYLDVNEFPDYIEYCIRCGIIKDSGGYIERLLVDPDYYPDAVVELIEPLECKHYRGRLLKHRFLHIFGLLYQRRMLLF